MPSLLLGSLRLSNMMFILNILYLHIFFSKDKIPPFEAKVFCFLDAKVQIN